MESYQKQGGAAGTINPPSSKSVRCETCAEGKPDVVAGGRGGRRERGSGGSSAGDRAQGPKPRELLPQRAGRDSSWKEGRSAPVCRGRRSSIKGERQKLKGYSACCGCFTWTNKNLVRALLEFVSLKTHSEQFFNNVFERSQKD